MAPIIRLLLVGFAAVSISACATAHGDVPSDISQYDQPLGDGYGEAQFVVSRDFKLRTSPNVNARVMDRIPESTRLTARVTQVDDVWYHIDITGGPDGYMFGLPLQHDPY